MFILHQKMYNLFIVYLLQNLISQTILVFECRNMKCRLEVRSTRALVFQKVYMGCPRERRTHTYIHYSVSWSPVWCIYVSLVHWYTLSLTRIGMIIYWTWYPFWTPIITALPLLIKLIFIIFKHSVFIFIYSCTQNTNVFVQIHVNFSLFGVKNLFLSMYKKLFL